MMWNQINILIYLSLSASEFYFSKMSVVIIRTFSLDTIRLHGQMIYHTASLYICENQLFVKKDLNHLRFPPLNVLNNKLRYYSILNRKLHYHLFILREIHPK